MSFDGPCTVLRGSMHGFPFNKNDTRLPRSQLHPSRHVRQQHQPAAALAPGPRSRRPPAERKENTEPSLSDPTTDNLSPVFSSGTGSGVAWDPDVLPPLPDTPRFVRSMSSLVLSSDEEYLSPTEPATDYDKVRGARDPGAEWNILDFPTTTNPLLPCPTPGLPPMPTGTSCTRLQREPSFPPPPTLSSEPSFPPLDDPGMMLGTRGMAPEHEPRWRGAVNTSTHESDMLPAEIATTHASAECSSSGNSHSNQQLHRLGSGTIPGGHGRGFSKAPLDATFDGTCDVGHVGGGVSNEGLYSVPPSEPNRKFDQLALLIPGVPQPFHPSQTETEKPRLPDSTRPAVAPRGRPTSRLDSGRRRSKVEEHGRGSGRAGRHRGSGKIEDAPGSAGPPSTNGGPVDLAKKARREAAIKKYMYKRSRRKFANSIREASPSRSRPKAARIRPRRFGKFIKTVPDFIPVTAVVPENSGEVDQKARTEQAVNRSMGTAGSRRGVAGVKGGFLTPIAGGIESLDRSSFHHHQQQQQQQHLQHQHQQLSRAPPAVAVDTCSVLDGYTPLWATSSM